MGCAGFCSGGFILIVFWGESYFIFLTNFCIKMNLKPRVFFYFQRYSSCFMKNVCPEYPSCELTNNVKIVKHNIQTVSAKSK